MVPAFEVKLSYMEKTIFERKMYLAEVITHREYYGQFVTDAVRELVKNTFGIAALKAASSSEKGLSSISLAKWDHLVSTSLKHHSDVQSMLKIAGDYLTLAGGVCLLKEAAQQIIEQN